ncbi:hypothetical protein ACWDYH_34940 [Nocardia goodfellowii]|uniref:Lipoprotein n=1 Tax=Nocardia goodfellowii TaxID=882446 RepID=A0ABS4QQQ7_9NOCA|nr:hypothetical protein [Nocardia goodfellowii]MBP2193888.1 hypothetical protein [Nocardia goodfellowii]
MTRTTAAIAASTTVFAALLLAGCGGEDKAAEPAASASSAAGASAAQIIDSARAGTFVVSYKSAFPKLATGRTDAQIAEILTETCKDVKAAKSEDAIVGHIVELAKNGSVEASKEEAQSVYQMAKIMCG